MSRAMKLRLRPKLQVLEAENCTLPAAERLRAIADEIERGEVANIIFAAAYKGRNVSMDFWGESTMACIGLNARLGHIMQTHWDEQ
jgi:hypothetical protein